MYGSTLVLFVLSLLLTLAGQLLARFGAGRAGFLNPYVVLAYLIYLVRGGVWVLFLRKVPLGRAYPLQSLVYPLVLFLSVLLFQEPVTLRSLAGMVCILGGGYLLLREEP